ncbi:MAG: aminopeptidase P N-terminal domain-containing protein, partial [Cyclobacteriaceae bacterium]|nr:aminopeptidase P N-terminal domain-containing protein [Cyclobacteriaceae bacterium]
MKSLLFINLLTLSLTFSAVKSQDKPDDYLNSDFHKGRREALRKKMPPNSVAVFFANPVRNRANDVQYVYHQDPDFYYLTGHKEPHAVLLVFKDFQQSNGQKYNELIFVRQHNALKELYDGARLGKEGAREKLQIAMAFEGPDFKNYAIDFSGFDKVLFYKFFDDVRQTNEEGDLYDLIAQFKEKVNFPDKSDLTIEPKTSNIDLASLDQIMNDLRGIKTKEELVLLRKAVNISTMGQVEVMKAMRPGMSETEIQGLHEYVYKVYQAEYEGYPSIVGAGHNGCVLHYIDNYKPSIEDGELILMDLGAEYHGYTADVTRTIPVNGTFTEEQKAIYNIVYEAQEAAFKICKEGTTFRELSEAVDQVVNEGLVKLGLYKSTSPKDTRNPET